MCLVRPAPSMRPIRVENPSATLALGRSLVQVLVAVVVVWLLHSPLDNRRPRLFYPRSTQSLVSGNDLFALPGEGKDVNRHERKEVLVITLRLLTNASSQERSGVATTTTASQERSPGNNPMFINQCQQSGKKWCGYHSQERSVVITLCLLTNASSQALKFFPGSALLSSHAC